MEMTQISGDAVNVIPIAPTVLGPAEIMALFREKNLQGFARSDTVVDRSTDAFRPVAASSLVRLRQPIAELDDANGPETAQISEDVPALQRGAIDIGARLTAAREEGHAAGVLAGLAEGAKHGVALARAELAHARQAFEAAVAHLIAPTAADIAGLTQTMDQALCTLASQRAGQQIDVLPLPFLQRIEALADRVGQGFRQISFRMNPDDLAAISPHLAGSELLASARLRPDARLARGDLEIIADGVRVADILCPADDGLTA